MDNLDLEEKIQIILRQTNYSYNDAKNKLIDNNNDPIKVIKDYIGIKEKINTPTSSINQEIYKQLREKMNNGIKDYNNKIQNQKVVLH